MIVEISVVFYNKQVRKCCYFLLDIVTPKATNYFQCARYIYYLGSHYWNVIAYGYLIFMYFKYASLMSLVFRLLIKGAFYSR